MADKNPDFDGINENQTVNEEAINISLPSKQDSEAQETSSEKTIDSSPATPEDQQNAAPSPGDDLSVDVFDKAQQVVVKYLELENFIDNHKPLIYNRLEKAYSSSINQPEGDITFIADVMPLISAIVQVGSNEAKFKKAKKWVAKFLPKNAKPEPALSALTFIYVVDRGYNYYSTNKNEEKRAMWEKMRERVETLVGKSKS